MIKSATLLGSSSGRNAGDAALMSGIMDSVDTAIGEKLLYEIPTIKPNFVARNYLNRVQPVSMLPWNLSIKMLGLPTYRSVMRTDISLIFDAILFDRALYNPLFNFLSSLWLMLPKAKKHGKRLGFFNVGTGPVSTPQGIKMLRELSDLMDFITVRDTDSYDILMNIGVKNPRILLTADAALNVQAAPAEHCKNILAQLGFSASDEILALNINNYLDSWSAPGKKRMSEEDFLATYSAAINRIAKEYAMPILLVVTQHDDIQLTEKLRSKITSPSHVVTINNRDWSHYEIKGVLAQVALLFAMRLHAIILATSEYTPAVGLAYQPKVQHYFNSLGLAERSLHFDRFNETDLFQHLSRAWEEKKNLRARLNVRIPELKGEALKAAELVAALSRGEDLDKAISRLQSQAQIRTTG